MAIVKSDNSSERKYTRVTIARSRVIVVQSDSGHERHRSIETNVHRNNSPDDNSPE